MISSAIRVALPLLLASAAPLAAHDHSPTGQSTASLAPSAKPASAVVDAFHAALRRGDTRGALGFLGERALIYEAGGAERSKAEYAAEHLAADAAFSKAVPSTVARRSGAARGNLAWVATEGRTTGTFSGKPIDSVTTETMILERTGPNWRIVHIHWSSAKKQ